MNSFFRFACMQTFYFTYYNPWDFWLFTLLILSPIPPEESERAAVWYLSCRLRLTHERPILQSCLCVSQVKPTFPRWDQHVFQLCQTKALPSAECHLTALTYVTFLWFTSVDVLPGTGIYSSGKQEAYTSVLSHAARMSNFSYVSKS